MKGMTALKTVAVAFAIACLTGAKMSGQLQTVVIFDETFAKDVTGTVEVTRAFTAAVGPATVSLTNGTAGNFDIVRNGRIAVNGQPLFTNNDFKVAGTISRTIAAIAGANTLDVSLGGPAGGEITVKVSQETPPLQFSAGTIFVSIAHPNAADTTACGSAAASPCRTIQQAITRAVASGGVQVVVGDGIYPETVTLVSGISLLGGYDVEFTRRDLTVLTPILRGTGSGLFGTAAAVSAQSIQRPTVLEGFIILAPPATIPSSNSIGIRIENSTDALTVRNNLILGGVGAPGVGGPPGSNGPNAADGGDGSQALSFTVGSSVTGGIGGEGGAGGRPGGSGGWATYPWFNQRQPSGGAGFGTVGGQGGFDGQAVLVAGSCAAMLPTAGSQNGADGSAGAHGAHGSGGAGGSGGAFLAGVWSSQSGALGASGERGGGGSGGGAGGGLQGLAACDPVFGGSVKTGPAGGGGGGGAYGGSGGGPGSGGGSSIGILVVAGTAASHPRIGANEIQLGVGGDGGNGGPGGVGGVGGDGGRGGAAALVANVGAVTGTAGNGGPGGNGGHGGGGGGGAGGSAFGILANFDGVPYATDNSFVTATARRGQGGAGGPSLAGAGSSGSSGLVAAVRFNP